MGSLFSRGIRPTAGPSAFLPSEGVRLPRWLLRSENPAPSAFRIDIRGRCAFKSLINNIVNMYYVALMRSRPAFLWRSHHLHVIMGGAPLPLQFREPSSTARVSRLVVMKTWRYSNSLGHPREETAVTTSAGVAWRAATGAQGLTNFRVVPCGRGGTRRRLYWLFLESARPYGESCITWDAFFRCGFSTPENFPVQTKALLPLSWHQTCVIDCRTARVDTEAGK